MTDAIAVTAMKNILGKPAAVAMALLIIAVIAGTLNGTMFVAGRLTVAAAHKHYLPSFFGYIGSFRRKANASMEEALEQSGERKEPRFNAPLNAYVLAFLLTSLYMILFDFRFLLTFDGMAEYTFFFLTVLGALILRYRKPQLHGKLYAERPYKPWIGVPVLFCLTSGAIVVRGAIFAPVQTLVFVAFLVAGRILYPVRNFGLATDE
jgi:amino acid transporter